MFTDSDCAYRQGISGFVTATFKYTNGGKYGGISVKCLVHRLKIDSNRWYRANLITLLFWICI